MGDKLESQMEQQSQHSLTIGPQSGPQTAFLECDADIAFYGGAAGGGKSYALLLEPLRHWDNPLFGGVIFRKTSVQVRNEGGLWDESVKLYSLLGAHPVEYLLEWVFPKGSRLKFSHLEYDKSVYDWQGSQIPFIGFDELTHFSEKQFLYMLSRNRSLSGVQGYVRATLNPDVDSWVRRWIDWYIGPDGYPIKERSGVIRWFVRINDVMHWGDSREELIALHGSECLPKSFTFIPSRITDNKILLDTDKNYLSNLHALSRVERMRLLDGNWDVRISAGNFFKREWFEVIETLPNNPIGAVRYWDRAATKPSEANPDPDWTRGLKLYKYPKGLFVVVDIKSTRDSPLKVENLVKNTASQDGYNIPVVGEQDPGSAGVADSDNFIRMLCGFDVRIRKPTNDKVTRAKPVSAQSEAGNIKVLRADWNEEFFTELENFPDGVHDDIVDTLSGAFNELSGGSSILDVI